ncbi:cytochrome P450 [Actinoplanes philippinensis]|uniref:cytochrome P450 n=1 Tax=Actinoplanes philippinensis TaxID=35752 RepID=UPI0033F4BC30
MSQKRARRRDRQVYLRSHPVLFALLAATRWRPTARVGGTVVAHSREAFTDALTRVPLDRTAEGTTGGAAGRLAGGGLLFDQEGDDHRGSRRGLAESLGAGGVARLRPVWTEVLDRRLRPLAAGQPVDLVDVAAELSGATAAALLGLTVDALTLASAARAAASAAAREHLPGLPSPARRRAAQHAAAHLNALVSPAAGAGPGLAAMLAVAAINTTVAGLPRAAAWCADASLWGYAETSPEALTGELLRVTAPTPLLPRVAAAAGTVAGRPVRRGDRLILVARHAAGAHDRDPSVADPAPPQTAQLVFGAGPHACPGARLARAQLTDTLAALAPFRPVIATARADRRSALPGWAVLTVTATR